MNNDRREELLEVCDILDDAINRLTEIREDEQDAFDSLPEGLQESSRGEAMQDAMDTLDGFEDDISQLRGKIEEYATPKMKKKRK